MIRIGILGNIGSGKSYVAKSFRYPVFNADLEVSKLYKNNKKIFLKLNKILPNYIHSFPINKNEMSKAILANKSNLNKIVKVVHKEVRKKMINSQLIMTKLVRGSFFMMLFTIQKKQIFLWKPKNVVIRLRMVK